MEPRGLDLTGVRHSCANGRGRFPAAAVGGKFAEVDERNLDMEIEAAVSEGTLPATAAARRLLALLEST